MSALCFAFGLFVLATFGMPAHAIPANPRPVAHSQPDGTIIQIFVKGDEFLGWTEDSMGNLITFDLDLKGFCYANWTHKGPVSTGSLVLSDGTSRERAKGIDMPQSLWDMANERREEQLSWLAQRRAVALSNREPQGSNSAPTAAPQIAPIETLKRKLLIIHATWADRAGINTPKLNGNQIHDLVFNPNTNSVNRYYKELLGIAATDIIEPAQVKNPLGGRQGIIEVTLPGRHTNPMGDADAQAEIMQRAIADASAKGHINYADFAKRDGDILYTNELSIGVIVDGYETAAGGLSPSFWGSAWWNYAPDKSLTNNVQIESAFGQGAFHRITGNTASDMLTVGVICHELAHSGYGFSDTYDYTNASNGHGYWSLMARGSWNAKPGFSPGAHPAYADAYNLVYFGLVIPGTISDSQNNVTANTHLDIYRLNSTARDTQYFLLQQRKFGSVDNYDRGTFLNINASSNANTGGLLIYHVDEAVSAFRINDKPSHYRVAIVEAHGGTQNLRSSPTFLRNYGDLGDLWGNPKNRFDGGTDPSSKLYSAFTDDSTPPSKIIDSGVEIWNIAWSQTAKNTRFNVGITAVPIANEISATEIQSFGVLTSPYAQPEAQTITITNIGTTSVALMQPIATSYDIAPLSATVLATKGATATFAVRPKADLPPGQHFETIVIRGNNHAIAEVQARVIVVGPTEHRTVNNLEELRNAINGYRTSTSNMVINVASSFSLLSSGYLTIPANAIGATLTLRSDNPQNPVTLVRGSRDRLFEVNSGAKLILEDIVIDGNMDAYPSDGGVPSIYPAILVSGELTMNSGEIRNSALGCGVRVDYTGRFVMNGGKISGNAISAQDTNGGGVYVRGGQFTMYGGEISGNHIDGPAARSGGGVLVVGITVGISDVIGKFTMNGGKISSNSANGGGGVSIGYGEFVMNGGEISGNSANTGGGVGIHGGGLTMYGGQISGNNAADGGGAFFQDGQFTFGGSAIISGNTRSGATNNVYLSSDKYLALSTATPPAGMSVGVHTASPSGIIVNSGARLGDELCFHADQPGYTVNFENDRIVITGLTFQSAPNALFTGQTWTFHAKLTGITGGINWYASAGTIHPTSGFFTAPSSAETLTITATSVQSPSINARVEVRIRPSEMIYFDGSTRTSPSFLGFANAFGTTSSENLAKYDLTGDGEIDDDDVEMLFRVMEW
jgi:M6 family metalloprotease-like protein